MRTIEQRKDVEELARQVAELEEERKKQARKISHLKEEMAVSDSQTQEKSVVAENAVQALSSELRTTKNALDQLKYREKEVRLAATAFSLVNLEFQIAYYPSVMLKCSKLLKTHFEGSHTFRTEQSLYKVSVFGLLL